MEQGEQNSPSNLEELLARTKVRIASLETLLAQNRNRDNLGSVLNPTDSFTSHRVENKEFSRLLKEEIEAVKVDAILDARKRFSHPDPALDVGVKKQIINELYTGDQHKELLKNISNPSEQKDISQAQRNAVFLLYKVEDIENAKKAAGQNKDTQTKEEKVTSPEPPDNTPHSEGESKKMSMSTRFFQTLSSSSFYQGAASLDSGNSPTPQPKGPEDEMI